MEIYREEREGAQGREVSSIACKFLDNGALRLEGYDLGPSVERLLGDSDYEYWIEIAADDLTRFTQILLREVFNKSEKLTLERLRDLCHAHGIDPHFGTWR